MSHPIEVALFTGLREVEVPPNYNWNETISLETIFEYRWQKFMKIIVSEGSAFLQNEGWEVDWDYPYYIRKNQSDGSLQICQQGRETPLYKSQTFSDWQWFTYRITCLYLTRQEVAVSTMFLAFITALTCYYWIFYLINSILGNSIQFILAFLIFNLICLKIVFNLAESSESK